MKLAVLSHIAEKFRIALSPICSREGIDLYIGKHVEDLPIEARDAIDMVLGDPPFAAEALLALPKLRWVQSTWAGMDRLLREEAARSKAHEIPVTGLPGVHGEIIADYVSAYVLAVHRNLFAHWEAQKKRVWKFQRYERLQGKEVCFLGTGAIASHVAERLEIMGLRAVGISRRGRASEAFREVVAVDDKDELLARADVVVSLLPLTDESRGLVDETFFVAMKRKPLFINVGRGPTVRQEHLIQALREGLLSAAVLDVFEKEPLPEESPLWTMENVILTPHVAGISFVDDIVAHWEANFHRFRAGESLVGVVDPDRGY